ncbi:uncharacterized protein LOC111316004 [Durio zibethinus]|uniref:Uncharacterized protein LOC111316004 n=1 Tax=Durio zibethinus TaxID=66656 RepID=A0A6P6B9Q8_DURZI|nr:uncharacterized protein LOC111316004 [Durio zibethinus]
MGNCWALLRPSEGSRLIGAVNTKPDQKVLQVVKMDGKILEFRAPVLVKDVLVKFSGSGIGLSKTVAQHLPLNYELKMGKVYYILPSVDDPVRAPTPESNSDSSVADTQQTGGVKRIKVVITKQELHQLLTKQLSVEEVLACLEKRNGNFVVSPRNWKPKLESISEENEQLLKK